MITNDYQYEHTQRISNNIIPTPRLDHRHHHTKQNHVHVKYNNPTFLHGANIQRTFQQNNINYQNNRPPTSTQPFRPPGFKPHLSRQTPMSGVQTIQSSHQFKQQRPFQNPGNRPYTGPIVEEVFNLNTDINDSYIQSSQFDPDFVEIDAPDNEYCLDENPSVRQQGEDFQSLAETIHSNRQT